MRVTMLTTACGPKGNYFADKTYDLPKEQAEEFIAANSAVAAPSAARVEEEPDVEKVPARTTRRGGN